MIELDLLSFNSNKRRPNFSWKLVIVFKLMIEHGGGGEVYVSVI